MAASTPNLQVLYDRVVDLLEQSLAEIKSASGIPVSKQLTAEYLLTEAVEYVHGTWALLKMGKPQVSLATSRWILEAALDLMWATGERSEVDGRLQELAAEALRREGLRLDGMARLFPNDSAILTEQAEVARRKRQELSGAKPPGLPSLETRLKQSIPLVSHELYALYRICCAAAHPGLDVWRRFKIDQSGQMSSCSPPDSMLIAAYVASLSPFYLIIAAHCLSGTSDDGALKVWWEQQKALLDS